MQNRPFVNLPHILYDYFKVFWLFHIIGYMRIVHVLDNFQLSSISPVMKVHYWVN